MRRYVSIVTLLALAPAVFSAAFLHTHGHQTSGHFMRAHSAQALVTHTHFSTCGCGHGHGGNVTMITDHDDDDEIPLSWFQDNPQPVPHLEFVVVETAIIQAPEPTASWIEVPTHRSHDPPLIVSLSPRSPPATPSSPLGA
jgi:hypothetical protein